MGGVEAGGTKLVCAVGTGPDDIRAETRVPTGAPAETIATALAFFVQHGPVAALGIASFGPVDLDPGSSTWGHVTRTPKPGWSYVDLAGPFARALGVPVRFDTDVNGAALAEHAWGAGRGSDPFVYVTVGTGIGGGALVHGRLVHGLVHPEMGHLRVPHDLVADPFPGACPFHGDCLEGLASGEAMARRWGLAAEELPEDHPGWELEAGYLALGLAAIVSVLSPRRIAVGGGVMAAGHLLPRVQARVRGLLGGYPDAAPLRERIEDYIVAPALGDRAGVLGALALAGERAQGRSALA
jgi:fructokinase